MKSGKSSSLLKKIFVISSLPAILAASYFYYGSVNDDGIPLCMFKLLLGIPCLGCGLTRAFCSLAHFEFIEAIKYHFLSPVVFLFIVGWYAIEMTKLIREYTPPKWWRPAVNSLLFAMAIMYSGRMVPFFSAREGYMSPLKHNITVRIVRWDWANTYEPWKDPNRQ